MFSRPTLFLLILTTLAVAAEKPAAPATLGGVKPLLQEFCVDCHNKDKQKGDFDFGPLLGAKLDDHREMWEKIAELIEAREMPPSKKPQPTDAQREVMLAFIDGQLSKLDCNKPRDPGKVTIRRLNKDEYRNTIRDLLNVDYDPEEFPNDEVGYGFDNIADVLSLSPMLMEKFLSAAETIVKQAIELDPAKATTQRVKGSAFQSQVAKIRSDDGEALIFRVPGEATRSVEFGEKGEFVFRIRARAEQAGVRPALLAVRIDGQERHVFTIAEDQPTYEVRLPVEAGWRKIALVHSNGPVEGAETDPKLRGDRKCFVDYLEMASASGASAFLPQSHRRLITRMPQAGQEREVALEILRAFASRAYRRPASEAEVAGLARFVELAQKSGGSFLEGIQAAVQAALCSPHFLFRWELDPQALKPGEVRELGDYEVASRLSYFLWSSLPDPELTALAAKGELRKDGNLEKQIARMTKDWKSNALVRNFAGQWLQIRGIHEVEVDPGTFPKWNDSLKGAMKEETERFFAAIMQEDRPVTDLVDADFTFLNEKLARHYGIDGVKGDQFQRVTLPKDSPRGGVLTQGSVLISTSTPTRTSPVIRGKWILEQILGTPPPPAPPDVPPLPEQRAVNQSTSLRQRLEQHRSNADCAGCHAKMDPLGFALENFDATGAWRDNDGKFPIDASGELANGQKFSGARELKQSLKGNKNFVRSLARTMMTYALGRGLEYTDKCAVDAAVVQIAKQDNKFSALVTAIVTSEPFLKRKNEVAKN